MIGAGRLGYVWGKVHTYGLLGYALVNTRTRLDTTLTDDYAVLTLKGEFDTFHCPRFQEEIEDILERDVDAELIA